MKKILFTVLLLALFIPATAQVKVSCTAPDVEVVFKRCIATGGIVYVDFLLTNFSGSTLKVISIPWNQTEDTSAYDDEGNVYSSDYKKSSKIASLTLAGEEFGGMGWGCTSVSIPNGIPVKGRLLINGVDEFATNLTLVKMLFTGLTKTNKFGDATIEFRNVPITRQ